MPLNSPSSFRLIQIDIYYEQQKIFAAVKLSIFSIELKIQWENLFAFFSPLILN